MLQTNYFYILKEREFVRSGEQTWKIGKTGQNPPCKRFDGYPKGSEIMLLLKVPNKDIFERKVIEVFKNKYHRMVEYGNEYYRGDIDDMIKDVITIKSNLDPVAPTSNVNTKRVPDIYTWFVDYAKDKPFRDNKMMLRRDQTHRNYSDYSSLDIRPKDFTNDMIRLLKCNYKKKGSGRHYVFNVEVTNRMLMDLLGLAEAPLKGYESDSSTE